ncbi:MAG: hypothetical protein BGP10_15890 [Rhodanobacter sp. 68-29]|nr:MAG: hypothetical protein BGP10_15890 [Rhodanobacter sp. 68-29]
MPFTGTRRQWAIVGLMLASIATIGWLWWRADQSRAAVQLAQAEAEAHDAPLRAARAAQTQYLDDRDALAPLITQWSEEVHKAAATPRMLLASRIDRLDAVIARIPSARVHGECMRTARDMFAAAARQRRDAFLAFAAQNSTSEATTRASALEQRLVEQMAACKPTDSSM